jgi:uncharacterized protein YfbU (UPF0304 family)
MPNRLKLIRERKQISQSELARRIYVSRQALSAIESNKQDPSLSVALKIAMVLGAPLQEIFFVEDINMEKTKSQSLTPIERLQLVNQYRILQVVHKDDEYLVKHYARLEEIYKCGYVWLYRIHENLWDELPLEVSAEVLDILDMHRSLLFSLGEKPEPRDLERVKFKGFDANNESEYLGFAEFFCQGGDKYRELRIFNSHHPTLSRYRKMLEEWNRTGRRTQLTKVQIESILQAGEFNRVNT